MSDTLKGIMKNLIKISKWTAVVILAAFVILVIVRVPFYNQNKKTEAQVAKIHATKLTMDDVMGKNLPSDPGTEADKTIEGIDANENGIRDDVELAIFKEYPNSAKTRAVLLQYALALQMEMTQPFLDEGNVNVAIEQDLRAYACITDYVPRNNLSEHSLITDKLTDFVYGKMLNTEQRKETYKAFYKYIRSGGIPTGGCDIDLSSLQN